MITKRQVNQTIAKVMSTAGKIKDNVAMNAKLFELDAKIDELEQKLGKKCYELLNYKVIEINDQEVNELCNKISQVKKEVKSIKSKLDDINS